MSPCLAVCPPCSLLTFLPFRAVNERTASPPIKSRRSISSSPSNFTGIQPYRLRRNQPDRNRDNPVNTYEQNEQSQPYPARQMVRCPFYFAATGGFMLRSLRLFLVSPLILTFLPAFATAQRSPFAVGTASAAPGQKANGYLQVPAGADAGTNIPVVVVNGAQPGPILALVTGAHGTEYVSIVAVEKLIADLDPATISGTVILIPLVNIASFEQKVPHVN